MISLQSHNQVLYHLTQLTSTITPRSSTFAARNKSNNSKNAENKILCEDSLSEATKSFAELPINKLPIRHLPLPLRLKKQHATELVEQLSRRGQHKDTWNISYLSGASFSENKRHAILDPIFLTKGTTLNKQQRQFIHKLCQAHFSKYDVQLRHFKTDRNIKAEMERNPTLIKKLQKWLGIPVDEKLAVAAVETNSAADLEKLKNVLGNRELTGEEQTRVKVAFAEGYMAGNRFKTPSRALKFLKILQAVISIGIITVIFVSFMGVFKSSTNGGSMFRIQLGRHVEVDPEEIHVSFNDVKGVDDAKQELKDVVEFLKNPDKFSALGGKLPKGVLLVGPPGTGKTLLARAVAGEAGVPFFHAAGPEFDEILVGQGARRVRDLFKAAKDRAPCVIFIDEIDSVGAKRTNSVLHPYANQTINQLLSEMDGFHQNEGVIVLGATNRREDLDKALMRPGRFDVEIFVTIPDYAGRKEILDLYLGRILTRDITADSLARNTTGFTGADLENMVNQAALRAAIEGAEFVTMRHLEYARDKVILGPEGKKKVADDDANRITAYHEAGHALVAYYTKEAKPVHKVSIIPRGTSLGHTSFIPDKDTYHTTKAELLAAMDACMGGRAGEELIFGPDKITTGAYDDLKHATLIAENMVKNYGMSEKVGFRTQSENPNSYAPDYSPSTTELIDNEVKRFMQESYDRAKTILKTHSREHKLISEALLKHETLDLEDMKAIIGGKKTRKEISQVVTATANRTIIDVPPNNVVM